MPESSPTVVIGCVCTHTHEICNDRVDLGVAQQWCSRPEGHEGLHVACAPLGGWHQQCVWGRDGVVFKQPFPEEAGVVERGDGA